MAASAGGVSGDETALQFIKRYVIKLNTTRRAQRACSRRKVNPLGPCPEAKIENDVAAMGQDMGSYLPHNRLYRSMPKIMIRMMHVVTVEARLPFVWR